MPRSPVESAGNLRVEQVAAQLGQKLGEAGAEAGLEPALRSHTEKGIGVRSVGVAAEEEATEEIAAKVFVFRRERGFVCARAEGDFVLARKGVGRCAVAHPGELKAVEEKPGFGRGVGTDLDASAGRIGNEREKAVDAGLAALQRGGRGKCVNQARVEVAGVAKVDRSQLLAALVESEQCKVGGGVIEPGHALGGGAPGSCRNNHFQPAEVAARVGVVAAVVEPENAQGEDAVDDRCGFGVADPDHRVCGRSFEQAAAHIGRAEAVLKIHGRAHAVNFGADEVA